MTSGPRSRAGDRSRTRPGGPTPHGGGEHRGPAGGRRSGRRQTNRPPAVEASFLQRFRGPLIGGVAVAAIAVVAAFLLFGGAQPAFACEAQMTPAPSATPLPDGSPGPLGQAQPDMGRHHIPVGESARYALCPPASGPHYTEPGGPIPARFYPKDEQTLPQGWIHDLEHGGLALLYRCTGADTCDAAQQDALRQFAATFPASPVCALPAGQVAPVVTRFDEMATPYAAVIWGRVLPLQALDTAAVLRFFADEGERTNPEPQCAGPSAGPGASPGPASAGPSASPAPASAGPSASPSPS